MFTFIFYAIGIVAIMFEVWKTDIRNYNKLRGMEQKFRANQPFDGNENAILLLMFGYFIWGFIGLFSSQWFVFLFIIILSFSKHIIKGLFYNRVDSILTLLAIVFAILNRYHFHLTLKDIF